MGPGSGVGPGEVTQGQGQEGGRPGGPLEGQVGVNNQDSLQLRCTDCVLTLVMNTRYWIKLVYSPESFYDVFSL